jgi:hypothetical protein
LPILFDYLILTKANVAFAAEPKKKASKNITNTHMVAIKYIEQYTDTTIVSVG